MSGDEVAIQAVRDAHNKLRGRLFGAIEAVGLPDKQENAIKGLIRQVTYEAQASAEAAIRRLDVPGATATKAIPYPLLTDPADIETDGVKDTADAIDALFVPEAWHTVALTGFNASTPDLSYFKDSLGIVHFRGDALVVGGSNIAALATLCTLPAGYRPGSTPAAGQWFVAVNIGSTGGIPFKITPAGVVSLGTNVLTANVSFSFGTTHFRADN